MLDLSIYINFFIGLLFYKLFDFNDWLIIGNIVFVLVIFTLLFENKEFRYVLPLSPLFASFYIKNINSFIKIID